jgi:serine/threonine protein kinase
MKQVCLLCQRQAIDRNLFCPEPDCPAEQAPFVFEQGEWFEDFEILRLVVSVRSAALYKAQHHRQHVLLKIAHPGQENRTRLGREVEFLRKFAAPTSIVGWLPQLQPAYINTTIDEDPYGITMVGENLLCFAVFSYVEGDSLHHLLLQRKYLWINDAGWISIQLAQALQQMHDAHKLHLALNPSSLLVRFDKKNQPKILLWDLGQLLDKDTAEAGKLAAISSTSPAHLAPELLDDSNSPFHSAPLSFATDVYSIGTIFFEMLVGNPLHAHTLRSDEEVRRNVQSGRRHRMTRQADASAVAQIITKSLNQSPESRQANIAQFLAALLNETDGRKVPLFVALAPKETRSWFALPRLSLATLWLWIIALTVIAALVVSAVWLSQSGLD